MKNLTKEQVEMIAKESFRFNAPEGTDEDSFILGWTQGAVYYLHEIKKDKRFWEIYDKIEKEGK